MSPETMIPGRLPNITAVILTCADIEHAVDWPHGQRQ
eukprot:CAMPEP_0116822028 /NCGR_PEP_ID=MMETSP0418-20121206/40_1 /TAXON_ID=1158023 /ORGANISM="Astrosyne radiata, Strain 13vi08-1A" /LENGTH=36 /DNA_ID= /DNA_START= /DNA_END= /DNA_ORIENTATION=